MDFLYRTIAIIIKLFDWEFLKKRNLKHYFVIVVLSLFFHIIALIILIFHQLTKIKSNDFLPYTTVSNFYYAAAKSAL